MAQQPQRSSTHIQQQHQTANVLKKNQYECSSNDYDQAEAWCRQTISSGHEMMFSLKLFHQEIARASNQFGLSFEALHSLFRNAHVTHMKRNGIRSQTMRHVKSYLNGTSILNLARKCNYPPSMMARLIVENVASPPPPLLPKNPNNSSINNTSQGDAMRGKDRIHNSNNNKSTQVSKANTINTKKFVTEAIRYPEKVLGCASTSILPEYLFSEKNGSATIINTNNNLKQRGGGGQEQQSSSVLLDNFSQKPLYENNEVSYPSLSRLSLEVRWAIDMDPMYGPRSDRERHNVGIEYELLLEQTLRSMDIPFETEAELRVRGTARTPDILLSCPVGVRVRRKGVRRNSQLQIMTTEGSSSSSQLYQNLANLDDDDEYEWKIVCWIDSKALFGDVETHTNSVLPQVETYVHRFGPGLVLYWFGHAPLSRLGDGHGDVVVMGGDLPELLLMPTGEFHGRGGKIEVDDSCNRTLFR